MATTEQQIQWLVDRAEITDTLHEWLDYVDTKQFAKTLDLCTEDCEFEYDWGILTAAQLRGRATDLGSEEHTVFSASHHMLTNHRIDVDGDVARASLKVQAAHIRDPEDADSWYVIGGIYNNEFRRTEDGWRMSRVKLAHTWETGDSGMPSLKAGA